MAERHRLISRSGTLARAAVRAFGAVRDLPYATNAAHDADALRVVGRGDCLAKSALLIEELERLGLCARRVRLRYLLPRKPVEVRLLPSRYDMHSAVQVRLGERWTLLDATHDPLLSAELTVADWDGSSDTPPAYEPVGPILGRRSA
jgi:transglutaminase-like putative cysteine protease